MALMENECELKRFVLSALKYGRFHSLNSPLIALIACISIGLPPCVCLYKRGRSSLAHTHKKITSARAATIVPLSVAATGDPIPSAAYTVAGRAGLRNPASPHPVRERGD